MKWKIDPTSGHSIFIIEDGLRPNNELPVAVCMVLPPTPPAKDYSRADRDQMEATAREIVEDHNTREATGNATS